MRTAIPAFAIGLLVVGAHASQSYHAPASGEAWKVTRCYLSGEGKGVVAFLCNDAERQHRIQIYAKGLEAGQAYSLWLRQIEDGKLVREKRVTRKLFAPKANSAGVFSHITKMQDCHVASYNDVVLVKGTADTSDGVLFGTINQEAHEEEDESAAEGEE